MRRGFIAAMVVGVAGAGLVLAQAPATKKLVPHEDLPSPSDKSTPMIGDTGSGKNPAAFTAGDKVLPKPAVDKPRDMTAAKTEPVLGKGGFAADRQTDMRPDENTGPDSTLHYVSVFNPDVLPFKRMSAFDAVGDDQKLHVARNVLSEIPVGGTTDFRTRDRFWGDVLLDLKPGVDVALPSVAPDMRILSYEVKPKIALKFSKDGADNFYVKSDESSASGTYRLVFLADADAGYFAPQLPKIHLNVGDIIKRIPDAKKAELLPVIPQQVKNDAKLTLKKLGIDDPALELGYSFNKLVGYFRAFTAKEIPHPSGDIYRDLCDSQAGVCRHRAFAFMITANALGIPTRYVENEAHAFVEVWFPERNWQRIDLGGAALRMEVSGADNKTLHRPRGDDPFMKPPEYKQSYTQLEGEIHGLSDQQLKDKHKALDQAPASGALSGAGAGPDRINPNPNLPAVVIDPNKASPKLVVTQADPHAYRGDVIHVEGIVRVGDKGIGDHRVDIFLAPAGDREHSVSIGNAVTGADGTFRVDLAVPGTLNLTTYDILLSSGEDAYYNAALSD